MMVEMVVRGGWYIAEYSIENYVLGGAHRVHRVPRAHRVPTPREYSLRVLLPVLFEARSCRYEARRTSRRRSLVSVWFSFQYFCAMEQAGTTFGAVEQSDCIVVIMVIHCVFVAVESLLSSQSEGDQGKSGRARSSGFSPSLCLWQTKS